MALTRTAAETLIVNRIGPILIEVGMDGTTAGSNADLVDAEGWALRMLGISPASYTTIADGDLDDLTTGQIDAFLDLAELRALETALTNLTAVTVTVGPVSESKSDLGTRLQTLIQQRRVNIAATWGGILDNPLTPEAVTPVRLRVL